MRMFTSINNFTASLAGTLFNSLETLHSSPRPIQTASQEAATRQTSPKSDEQGPAYSSAATMTDAQKDTPSLKVATSGKTEDRQDKKDNETSPKNESVPKSEQELTLEQKQIVRELQQRDQEVRSHEQAHISAGGPHVHGGASYSYEDGPDGKQYATGGSVNIDTSPVPGNPEATLEKAQIVRKAALAPATPSAQDQKVASEATQMESEARQDITEDKNREEKTEQNGPDAPNQRFARAAQAYSFSEQQLPGSFLSSCC
jgi:hypothetical protein